VPLLAWIGLGADGLSSSSYGPEEAYRALGGHTWLAIVLAAMVAGTIFLISAGYRRIIDLFPHGGGGYVVATKLLGERAGLVSGAALLVDYVLTITVSIAAAGDALFSFVPSPLHFAKLPVEAFLVLALTALNIRGVRESVLALSPIFVAFVATHVVLIGAGIAAHADRLPEVADSFRAGMRSGTQTVGILGLGSLLVYAYSLGGGTYTGIEAVSNGLPIMREPRVHTARRTMSYMSWSLALTAAGLLLCYLLFDVAPAEGRTLNAVLADTLSASWPGARAFALATIVSEGALLVVAAQAGFADGPRVMANMAVDSWMPRRLASLSERLTTQNGIALMGGAALAALVWAGGDLRRLVTMYSINVFLTFSLSMFGMLRHHLRIRPFHRGAAVLFAGAFTLCATILAVMTVEKLREGAWLTLATTGAVVALCTAVRRHYRGVSARLASLDAALLDLPVSSHADPGMPDPRRPTAAIMVAAYSGLGIHTVLNLLRSFPGYFAGLVFVSVGLVDSGEFKGEAELDSLRRRTDEQLRRYAELARRLGVPSATYGSIGTDPVDEGEKLLLRAARDYPRIVCFAGQVIFQRERWYDRLLHNGTAYAVQKRLQWRGLPMMILPVRVR